MKTRGDTQRVNGAPGWRVRLLGKRNPTGVLVRIGASTVRWYTVALLPLQLELKQYPHPLFV